MPQISLGGRGFGRSGALGLQAMNRKRKSALSLCDFSGTSELVPFPVYDSI
jgi:hypothetical protein